MSQHQAKNHAIHRVLVVDDNALMRLILSSMLISRGYSVVEEPSAESALDRLQRDAFDLLVLDIMMFRMSGVDLCQIVRNELGLVDLPVVAYTVNSEVSEVARMRKAGFNNFLFKPVDGPALDTVLRDVHMAH